MNIRLLVILAIAVLASVAVAFSFVGGAHADTTGNFGSFSMPNSGYATRIDFSLQAENEAGNSGTIYLKDNSGNVLASHGVTFAFSVSGYFPFTPVFMYKGDSYQIVYTPDYGPDIVSSSASLTYTPYFLITVNSAYGSPTSSAYVQSGASYDISVSSPDTSLGAGIREVCTGYSVDGGGSVAGTSYSFSSVTADHSITFSWQRQYQVSFGASGLDGSASGTVVSVNGFGSADYSSLPYQIWVNSGTSLSFTYTNPVPSSNAHYRFSLSSVVSSPQTINAPTTISDTYSYVQYQFAVTYSVSGLDSSASGTTVTIDGSDITYSSLPYTKYVDYGSSTTFAYASTVSSSTPHQRFALSSATTSPQTIYGTTSISATYITQATAYLVTFATSGLDSSAQGAIVTVNGTTTNYGSMPYQVWINTGDSVAFNYSSTVSSGTTGKQFRLSSSVNSPQTINANTTITDGYTIQYYLTVSSAYSSPLYAGWYDAGSTAYCSISASTVAGTTGIQYVFTSWSGSGSSSYTGTTVTPAITMNGPVSETANWQTQYYLTVTGVYSTTTGSGWYVAGTTVSFNVSSPVSGGTGIQTAFSSWSGSGTGSYSGSIQSASCTMNAPITETANWVTQYYLTVTSIYGTPLGGGWYNSGATAYAGLNSGVVAGSSGTRYVFVAWSVGGSNFSQSTAIVMSYPVAATASWSTQYYLTVISAYSTPSGAGWYNVGSTAYASVASNIVSSHILQGWGTDASGTGTTSNAIVMSSPKTALASWTSTGGGGSGPVSYSATLYGPYYDNTNGQSSPAAGQTIQCSLLYANNTLYQFNLNSSVGVPGSLVVSSTSPFVQLTWNVSSTNNNTRIYTFISSQTSDTVHLCIPNPAQPSFIYTFSVTDFYGMVNPYLETRISPDGNTSWVVERANLADGGGYVTFVLTQYQLYSLAFVCRQGTYTQSFTAQSLGMPGQLAVNLNVFTGNFPLGNSSAVLLADATRVNGSSVLVSYVDPSSNTSFVYVRIWHFAGSNQIVDYPVNSTSLSGASQSFSWNLADPTVDYYVDVASFSGGQPYSWTLAAGKPAMSTNPFTGLFDFLGPSLQSLPQFVNGWGGIDPAQIIAYILICFALGVGSYFSTGASCILAWVVAGITIVLGWFNGAWFAPQFFFAGFITVLVVIDEYKRSQGAQVL